MEPVIREKIRVLELLGTNLDIVKRHVEFVLLKSCLGTQKMIYLLRTSPLWKRPDLLKEIDDVIRRSLEKVVNAPLSEDAFVQAALPIRYGGVGIRSVLSLALPCYLSSVASVEDQVLLTIGNVSSWQELRSQAEARWLERSGRSEVVANRRKQRDWDEPLCSVTLERIKLTEDKATRARILGVSTPESGQWLNARPSIQLNTFLSDEEFTAAMALRLGLPLFEPHDCSFCGDAVTSEGTHGLRCRFSVGRMERHYEGNNIIKKAFARINIPSKLEPRGITRNPDRNDRPDGVTHIPFERGRKIAWDFVCADTLAPSYINATSQNARAAAENRALHKQTIYSTLDADIYEFVPFAVETTGAIGKAAIDLINRIGKKEALITGNPLSKSWLSQRLSIAIQRSNAHCMMATLSPIHQGS